MPESVKAYIESNSFIESIKVQQEIILSYIDDFAKYAMYSNKDCLEEVFANAAVMTLWELIIIMLIMANGK